MSFQFPIIKKTWRRLLIAVVLTAVALRLFLTNLRFSIQFTWGMEVVVEKQIEADLVQPLLTSALEEKGYSDFSVGIWEKDGFGSVLVQIAVTNDAQIREVTDLVQEALLSTQTITSEDEILELAIIWPSVGAYIQKTAKAALIRGMILMGIYILFAFSSMRGIISPVLLGAITIVTVIFDVAIPAGAYGLLMQFNPSVQIDTIFIIALLTVMGYSINDTIVIFDRLRENFLEKKNALEKGQTTREEIFETSLWQTMRRSLATGVSTMIVVTVMRFLGTGLLGMFAFTLGIGIIAGTYSSIFIAAPLAYILSWKLKKTEVSEHKKWK